MTTSTGFPRAILRRLLWGAAFVWGAATSLSLCAWASPTLITFDDLPATTSWLSVSNGYSHLNWKNFSYCDGFLYGAGFRNGVVSPRHIAYSGTYPSMITNGLGFDLISAYATAAWRNGLQLRAVGSSNNVVLFDHTYTLSPLAPTFISFNYTGVTQVTFTTSGGTRYFGDPYQFVLDNVTVSVAPVTPAVAADAFDQLWSAFDRYYAMFVLRTNVDWNQSREQFRPLATNSTSVYDLADVFAQMLRPLQDLHVWLTVSGSYVPVYTDSPTLNANPAAYSNILGGLNSPRSAFQWAVTPDKIGFIAIHSWSDSAVPALCGEALERMRDTRGLIIDVRSNSGGSEALALQVARAFQHTNFVYAFYQIRNGTNHTDLTPQRPRNISPLALWRYDRPIILLIGQVCMSSDESFIAMMAGATNVTTMGERTRGSSGNPSTVQLPCAMAVGIPSWIDYLPDGTLLEQRGIQPQIPFTSGPGDFTGTNDALLSASLARLRPLPLPVQPILGPALANVLNFDDLPTGAFVPTDYRGLIWSNFFVYSALAGSNPGYNAGMVSSPNVVYNRNGTNATILGYAPFDLLYGVFTAGYRSNLNLQVIGYIGTNVTYDTNITLSPTSPTPARFEYYGVTAVSFLSSGGTPYYSGNYHFVVDDLVAIPHNTPPLAPVLQNLTHINGTTTFTWAAHAGDTYQVQYTPDLAETNWINLGTPLTTGNYTLTGIDASTSRERFYRVVVLP